jgi:LPS-assembly protein
VKSAIPSSLICTFCLVSIIHLFVSSTISQAATFAARQWEISADKLTRHENPPTLIAEGNVVLEKKEPVSPAPPPEPAESSKLPGEPARPADVPAAGPATELKTVTTVKADWVSYDITQGLLSAKGNLFIDIGADQLTADSGSIDLEKATGSFDNATVIRQDKNTHLEGKVIEKTGDLTYHIKDGWVITCKLQPGQTPPWSFAAKDVEITDGGYAYLEHATFRIKDVPVMYMPVMLLPAKRTRQTGFLFPFFSFSDRDGFGLETPFFINLSPSSDLTLFPRYFANRGVMVGAEFRYVLDEDSKGMLMGNYLDDALSDPSEVNYYKDGQFTHTNSDRYWIRGKADQDIGAWTTRLDLDIASDLDYLREFNTGSTGFNVSQKKFYNAFGRGFIDETNRYRENSLVALRSWDNGTSLLGEALAVNDITEQVYTADDPSRAWTLPSLTYSGLIPVASTTGPDFFWDANYTNFWRDKGVGAQRIDLMPMVTAGIPLNEYLETTLTGGIRNTSYIVQDNGASAWEDSDSENRFLSHLNGEIGTTLLRDFAVSFDDVNSLGHTLRPFVSYVNTSIPDQKSLPQFDEIDNLEEENAVYLGINNFFAIAGEHKGREFERDYAFLKAKQGYDLRTEMSDTPLTPIIVETGFYPLPQMRLKYTTNIDVYGDGAFLHSIDSDYYSDKGDSFSLDYRYDERTDVNSVRGSFWYLLPYNFAIGYGLERAIEQSETIEEIARLRYNQPCWSVEFSSYSTPGDQTYMLTFRLANIGSQLGFDLPGM